MSASVVMPAALAALGLSVGLYASEARAQTVSPIQPGWTFHVTPYLWLPSLDANLRFDAPPTPGGASSADVRVDSGTLLEALNFAAMLAGEARYGRFFAMTDLIYLDLGSAKSSVRTVDFVQTGRNPVSGSTNAGTESSFKGSIGTLAAGYTLVHGSWGKVDGFAGFRMLWADAGADVRLTADIAGPGPGQSFARNARLSRDETLFDGIVGLRGRFELGGGFHLPYSFDVGAGSSNLTWQAMAGVGYQTGWAGATLGYRYLSYEQSGSRMLQDVSLSGPFLAATFRF